MDNADMGESSCKKHPHDDSASDNNRPLKKAKFPWQVKGKFHLKDKEEMMDDENVPPREVCADECNRNNKLENEDQPIIEIGFENKVENNLEMLSDYLLKQDCNSINTLIFGADNEQPTKIVIENTDQSSVSTYPKYIPSFIVPNHNSNSEADEMNAADVPTSSSDASDSSSASISESNCKTNVDDQYLKRWQARQIAKGYVDNTINRVLDSWFVAPLPPYLDDNCRLDLDVTGLLDDLAGNDGIENEGILMAISAHGLQNNQPNSRNNESSPLHSLRRINYRNEENSNNNTSTSRLSDATINDEQLSTDGQHGIFSEKSNMSVDNDDPSETDSSGVDRNSNLKSKNNEDASDSSVWRRFNQPCNCSNTHARSNRMNITSIPFHRRNCPSEPTVNYEIADKCESTPNKNEINDNDRKNRSETEKQQSDESMEEYEQKPEDENKAESSVATSNDGQYEEHFDFIDAAVSYAIQAKGLIPF